MADLRRTPSVQHAVALIRDTVSTTVLEMEKLDARQIQISLNPGRRMFKPLMEGQTLDWAIRQLRLDKRPKNIIPNIGLVEAFEPFARGKSVTWFRECQLHAYPIGGGIIIPVRRVNPFLSVTSRTPSWSGSISAKKRRAEVAISKYCRGIRSAP